MRRVFYNALDTATCRRSQMDFRQPSRGNERTHDRCGRRTPPRTWRSAADECGEFLYFLKGRRCAPPPAWPLPSARQSPTGWRPSGPAAAARPADAPARPAGRSEFHTTLRADRSAPRTVSPGSRVDSPPSARASRLHESPHGGSPNNNGVASPARGCQVHRCAARFARPCRAALDSPGRLRWIAVKVRRGRTRQCAAARAQDG
jgi:hypothetical protein